VTDAPGEKLEAKRNTAALVAAVVVRVVAILAVAGVVALRPDTVTIIVVGGSISCIAAGRVWEQYIRVGKTDQKE
jgi:hypothetical protein